MRKTGAERRALQGVRSSGLASVAVLTALIALLGGCSKPGGEQVCEPGEPYLCDCFNGAVQWVRCLSDGRPGACSCVLQDAEIGGGFDVADAPDALGDGIEDGSGDGGGGALDSVFLVEGELMPDDGGCLEFEGGSICFPPGSLARRETVSVWRYPDSETIGYDRYSPVFEIRPTELVLNESATLTLDVVGENLELASLFVSRPETDGGGYDRVGGRLLGQTVEGVLPRLGMVFVANGVQYFEQASRDCLLIRGLWWDAVEWENSGMVLFSTVDDCWGRPVTGLTQDDFFVLEDSAEISSEAELFVEERAGLDVLVNILIDMSSSTTGVREHLAEAATTFVHELMPVRSAPVRMAIYGINGEAELIEISAGTRDPTQLEEALAGLSTVPVPDPASTNLYGGIIQSYDLIDAWKETLKDDSDFGAVALGYTVVFTDGRDTAGWKSVGEVQARRQALYEWDLLWVVSVRGEDYSPALITTLNPDLSLVSDDETTLQRDFALLANRLAGQSNRHYYVAYCSPKRFGPTHRLELRAHAEQIRLYPAWNFSAEGFSGGCDVDRLATLCDERSCGYPGCGSCNELLFETCNGTVCQ